MDTIQMALAAVPGLLPRRGTRYYRESDYVDLNATVGASRVDYSETSGVRVKTEIRDYLIKPVDLIINGEMIEPDEGDKIVDTNEDATRTYQVMCEGGVPWRYTDRYHTLYRIHVKQVDEAAL